MSTQEIQMVVLNVSTAAEGDTWHGNVGICHIEDRVGNEMTSKAVHHPGKNTDTGNEKCLQADLPTIEETHPNVVCQRSSRRGRA